MKGFRTLGFALALAVAGVLQTFDWATIIPQDKTWSGVAMIGVASGIAALRVWTTTPVGIPVVVALAIGASMFAPSPSMAADMPPPVVRKAAVQAAPSWAGGLYFGVHGAGARTAGQFTMVAAPASSEVRPSGAMAGATVGLGAWLGGLYVAAEVDGDYDWSKATGACGFAAVDCKMKDGYLLTQRLVLGATMPGMMAAPQSRGTSAPGQWPAQIDVPANVSAATVMPYLTGGVAQRRTQACVEAVGCARDWIVGWTAGGGLKIPVSQAVSLDLGYLYINWNKHLAPTQDAPIVFPVDFKATSEHVLRAGLQFHL